MERVKLGKKGQVTIPKAVLRSVGVADEAALPVEATRDGAIVLRPAAAYLIERYSDERIAQFEKTHAVADAILAKARKLIARKKK
jgi:AbrB family looped-hinge helix DNA binding protein